MKMTEEDWVYIPMDKVSLQICLKRNFLNFSDIFFLGVNFENLTIEFYVPYVFNMSIKFCSNQLFTIRSTNLFLYTILDHKNLKF